MVQELLDIEAAPLVEGGKPRIHGAKTRFAVKAGMRTARTVDTWLAQQVDVKEASVEAVAEAYGLNPMDLLIRVGRYAADGMPVRLTEEQIDEEQRIVLDDPTLDDEQKAYILRELDAMRTDDERILQEQRDRDRKRRRERINELIERAQRA